MVFIFGFKSLAACFFSIADSDYSDHQKHNQSYQRRIVLGSNRRPGLCLVKQDPKPPILGFARVGPE
jgi:hypothetical protein